MADFEKSWRSLPFARFALAVSLLLLSVSAVRATDHTVTDGTQSAAYSGADTLTKTGSGTFILNQRNTHTGLTTLNGGTLKLTASEALSASPIVINSGATLDLAKQNAIGLMERGAAITLNAGGVLNASTNDYSNLSAITLAGGSITSTADFSVSSNAKTHGYFLFASTVSVTADSTISAQKFMVRMPSRLPGKTALWTVNDGKTLTISTPQVLLSDSDLTDANPVTWTKLGLGTIELTDTARLVTYTNSTAKAPTLKISAGKVKINHESTLGVTKVDLAAAGTLGLNCGGSFTTPLTGSGTVQCVSTTAASVLEGGVSGFTGTWKVGSKGLVLGTSAPGMKVESNAVVAVRSNTTFTSLGMITGSGELRPSNSNMNALAVNLKVGNDTDYAASHTWSGSVLDLDNSGKKWVLSIEKVGTNTWTLNGANMTYSGATTVTAGTLELGAAARLTASAVTVGSEGTLKLSSTENVSKPITLNGGTIQTNFNMQGWSPTLLGTGAIVDLAANYDTVSGTGLSNFTGTWQMVKGSGPNDGLVWNTSAPKVQVLHTGRNFALSNANSITPTVGMISSVTNPNTTDVGTIRPSARSAAGVVTLQIGNDTNYENHTFKGRIENNDTRLTGITKVGTNTWTLTNANHTYTGPTNVNGGVLELASTAKLTSSAVTINAGGTLKNAGTVSQGITVNADGTLELVTGGTIGGTLTVKAGGIVTGLGSVDAGTKVSLASNSVLAFDLDANPATTIKLNSSAFDAAISVKMDVELDVTDPEPLLGKTFNLLTTDADVLSKLTFELPDTSEISWLTGYSDGNIWLMAAAPITTPEPASLLLFALGIAFLPLWRRNRLSA